MSKQWLPAMIVGIGLLLPSSAFAAAPVTWRNCMRLVAPTPVRPKPIETDVPNNGPFHSPLPPARPRQWISPTQHAEVFLDAAGVLRYDPATLAGGPCLTGNCPR